MSFWYIYAVVALLLVAFGIGGVLHELSEIRATLNQIRWLREP